MSCQIDRYPTILSSKMGMRSDLFLSIHFYISLSLILLFWNCFVLIPVRYKVKWTSCNNRTFATSTKRTDAVRDSNKISISKQRITLLHAEKKKFRKVLLFLNRAQVSYKILSQTAFLHFLSLLKWNKRRKWKKMSRGRNRCMQYFFEDEIPYFIVHLPQFPLDW